MLLENMAYTEVASYLAKKDVVLVPVGSVEQHSPYGLIGTDFIAAEAIARTVGDDLELLVAPTVCYGVSPHHMAFKGTIALSPATLMAMAADIVRSLVAHGFRRILFINGHGGNIVPLKTAFGQLKDEGLAGYFDVISWYAGAGVKKACREAFGDHDGQHATPSEVSITKDLRPSAFDGKATLALTVEKPKYYWPLTATEMRTFFPDGRMESAPWLATAEWGQRIAAAAAQDLAAKISDILNLEIL
ncbi:MAG: creatininase family protein [Desulfobacterales bacterium]